MRDAGEWAQKLTEDHSLDGDDTRALIIAARREAFEAGYRVARADMDEPSDGIAVLLTSALKRAGLKP